MATEVVNIKTGEPYDVYIGREHTGYRLPQSPFANPFRIGRDGNRAQVIAKYRDWICRQPDLCARARAELKGKRLACYCKPQDCHGDVLAQIAESAVDPFVDEGFPWQAEMEEADA